MMSILS